MRRWSRLKWALGLMPDAWVRQTLHHGDLLVIAGRSMRPTSWQVMYAADPCVYCGGPAKTLDHIQPKSARGRTTWTNLAPCCAACNSRKGSKPLLLFLTGHRGVAGRRPFAQHRPAMNHKRALVRHLLHPEKCPPPLRYPLAEKIIAAYRRKG